MNSKAVNEIDIKQFHLHHPLLFFEFFFFFLCVCVCVEVLGHTERADWRTQRWSFRTSKELFVGLNWSENAFFTKHACVSLNNAMDWCVPSFCLFLVISQSAILLQLRKIMLSTHSLLASSQIDGVLYFLLGQLAPRCFESNLFRPECGINAAVDDGLSGQKCWR